MENENYDYGKKRVDFKMPIVRLESFESESDDPSLFERISTAMSRRKFILMEDWEIKLKGFNYLEEHSPTIVIPCKDPDGRKIKFDGASIPLHWLVSFLTLGIFRPLGVMLVGSIVHDYAFRVGKLNFKQKNGKDKPITIDRHIADRLFKDIINTVNRLVAVGWIGWLFVRLGWYGVKYAGERFKGRPPFAPTLIVGSLALGITSNFIYDFISWWWILIFIVALYISIFIVGAVSGWVISKSGS